MLPTIQVTFSIFCALCTCKNHKLVFIFTQHISCIKKHTQFIRHYIIFYWIQEVKRIPVFMSYIRGFSQKLSALQLHLFSVGKIVCFKKIVCLNSSIVTLQAVFKLLCLFHYCVVYLNLAQNKSSICSCFVVQRYSIIQGQHFKAKECL